MCGIAGWVGFDSDLTEQRSVIAAMTDTMACRGPDDEGTWVRRHVALGHRRLATIDLPGGRQPMTMDTPRGTVAMVYSGEVYNFAELREVLRHKGHEFRTVSDTEVVLHGYLEWGEGVAQRLNGMFAFAVWDEREHRLVLVRDRLGVKPLYFYPTPDGVLFGSEPKAILANPRARRVVGAEGLRELFGFTMTPGWALWRGMREVLPGTTISLDRTGRRTSTYWTLPAAAHTDDLDTTIARVRELMTDIVHRQLVADVPRCVLLSGGLDSSAVTGIAAAHLAERGERLRTFSVDFAGREETFEADENWDSPDAPYIRDVAGLVGSRHRFVTLDPGDLADPALRRAVITARDVPVGFGETDTSLYLLFQAIKAESTVALSGESADEVFGGYRWFHDPAAVAAPTFPWLAYRSPMSGDRAALLHPDLRRTLDLDTYVADEYATAVAGVEHLPGESAVDRRMRVIGHLHLTRFRPDAARPQGPAVDGRRARGAGAVLRPPAGRVRPQRTVGVEDVRRQGEEPAARRDRARAAGLGARQAQESLSVHTGPVVRGRPPAAGEGGAGRAGPPGPRAARPGLVGRHRGRGRQLAECRQARHRPAARPVPLVRPLPTGDPLRLT